MVPIIKRMLETLQADAALSQMVSDAGGVFRLGDVNNVEPVLPLVCVSVPPTPATPIFVPKNLPSWVSPEELITYVVFVIVITRQDDSTPEMEEANALGRAIIDALERNITLLPLSDPDGEPLCIDIEMEMAGRFVRRREGKKEAVSVMCQVTCRDVPGGTP